ncbi:MAG: DUF4097 family beta strand repeat-containing protein, partial [Pyrinomonadaceae bacterium]
PRVNIRATLLFSLLLAATLVLSVAARADGGGEDKRKGRALRTAQETLPSAADVTISICVEAGDVTVRGWDRQEVRASASETDKIELRRVGGEVLGTNETAAATSPQPARNIEVLAFREGEPPSPKCNSAGSMELDVPRGSTVLIKVPGGDLSVSGVAIVRAETLSGEIELSGITKSSEATSGDGGIRVSDVKGRVVLRSISGEIEADGVAANDAGDLLSVKTAGGEVTLADVRHSQVSVQTTDGHITFDGPLTRGGSYVFKTHAGNVTLVLPPDASFQLSAKVYQHGEIETDFPIRQLPGSGLSLWKDGRLAGLHGAAEGAATLNLASFNGMIELRKK